MIKVFISYHHKNEQLLKEELLSLNNNFGIFENVSVDTGDIDDDLAPQDIRQIIRRNYLSESTVTLLIVGKETQYRKHVDWELYSSMYNGSNFGRSGVVVLLSPDCKSDYFRAPSKEIKEQLYPTVSKWRAIDTRSKYERRYPYLPPRIIDNLVSGNSKISITNWEKIINDPENLKLLIENAHNERTNCEYDMSRGMRKKDHNPS